MIGEKERIKHDGECCYGKLINDRAVSCAATQSVTVTT